MYDDHPFALCLTHDVDRPYKTFQSAYYALAQRDPTQLLDLLPGRNPYWQFTDITSLEEDLGVRSAFYFLDERDLFWDSPVLDWLSPSAWKLYAGRYDLADEAIVDVVRDLDAGGWEVGLHGSYRSFRDQRLLEKEKRRLEDVLGRDVVGVRQHYLNLDVPETWRRQAAAGFGYDASLGSTSSYGFEHGYEPLRPFEDHFVVFPLTAMETTLPDPGIDPGAAWNVCERLLSEAREHGAVMTVLWHVRTFSERDFPGYRDLYVRLVRRALEMGAWVGPPRDLYDVLTSSSGAPPTDGADVTDRANSPAREGEE